MRIHTSMPARLKPYFFQELADSSGLFARHDFQNSWRHLERAHIIGQPYPYHHTLVHWKLLHFGIKSKDLKEIIGQMPRLLLGGVKSFLGEIPVGNTGGANVPPLQPMEIPADLEMIIEQCR